MADPYSFTEAHEYIAEIRDYVAEHGALPPVGYNKKLSNWWQWARSQARLGRLNEDTLAAVKDLDRPMAGARTNATNAQSVVLLDKMVDEFEGWPIRQQDTRIAADSDEWRAAKAQGTHAWRNWWRLLITTRLTSPNAHRVELLRDRSVVLSRLLEEELQFAPPAPAPAVRKPRGLPALLAGLAQWVQEHGRRPSVRSADELERYFACWAFRLQNPGVLEGWCGAAPCRIIRSPHVSSELFAASVIDSALGGPMSKGDATALRMGAKATRQRIDELGTRWYDQLYQYQLRPATSNLNEALP